MIPLCNCGQPCVYFGAMSGYSSGCESCNAKAALRQKRVREKRKEARGPKPQSQTQTILQSLKSGETLTPLDAFSLCGCLALHSRVAELRGQGHPIKCELVKVNGKQVGRYSMEA